MSDAYDIAASGMTAQRAQMDVIAENLANAGVPRADGSVFHAKTAVFAQSSGFETAFEDALTFSESPDFSEASMAYGDATEPSGVQVVDIAQTSDPAQYRFDPGNPFAARTGAHKGYIALPGVDPIQQMVGLVSAGRAYDANVSMLAAAKQMDIEAADVDRV